MSRILRRRHAPQPDYILYDDFSVPLAAGAVNATVATKPGAIRVIGTAAQNTRTVTDTGNKISIASGVLSFETGETANDAVWYGSIPRAAGCALIATLVASEATNGAPSFGWDSAAAGAILDALNLAASGALSMVANGATAVTVGAYTATSYQIAAVMRATGMFWFIKGGAFTTWTLLWRTAAGTGDGLPAVASLNTTAVYTADNIRIPSRLWSPSPLAQDSFTRGNGAIGITDGAGTETGGSGLAWSAGTIATNKAVISPTIGVTDLVANPSMELNSGWNTLGTVASQVRSNDQAHTGTYSRKVTLDASGTWGGASTPVTAVVGTWYLISGWVLNSTLAANALYLIGLGVDLATCSYNQVTWKQLLAIKLSTVTSSACGVYAALTSGANANAVYYVDDVNVLPLTLSTLFSSLQVSTVDTICDVKVGARTAGTQAGCVARLDSAASPANFIIAYFNGDGNVKIDECIAGVYANLGTYAKAFTADDTLRLDLSGSAFRLYHITSAGVASLLGSGTTNRVAGSLSGLFSTFASNTFSAFSVWRKDGYAELDSM